MSSELERSLTRGLRQALAFVDGAADVRKYRVHIPYEIDARRIRTKLGMTQAKFAREFRFRVDKLRLWEQGRRMPCASERAYLRVIDRAPKVVQKALKSAA